MIQMTSQRTWAVQDSGSWYPVVGWRETEEGAAPLIYAGYEVIQADDSGKVHVVTVAQWTRIMDAVSDPEGEPLTELEAPAETPRRAGLQDRILGLWDQRPDRVLHAAGIADALGAHSGSVSKALGTMRARGEMERLESGSWRRIFDVS